MARGDVATIAVQYGEVPSMLSIDKVGDAATFAEPTRASVGIDCVLVNGAVAFERGRASDDGNGQVIRSRAAA